MPFSPAYFFQGCKDEYGDRYEHTAKDAKRSEEAGAKECRHKKSGIITDNRVRQPGTVDTRVIHHTVFYKMDWLKCSTNDAVW